MNAQVGWLMAVRLATAPVPERTEWASPVQREAFNYDPYPRGSHGSTRSERRHGERHLPLKGGIVWSDVERREHRTFGFLAWMKRSKDCRRARSSNLLLTDWLLLARQGREEAPESEPARLNGSATPPPTGSPRVLFTGPLPPSGGR